MSRKNVIIVGLLLLFAATGCQKFLDVNHDPNVIEELPAGKAMLPAIEVSLANQLMGWDFGISGAFYVQYWTQKYDHSQFKSLCEYGDASFGTTYRNLTAGVLNDLKRLKLKSEESGKDGEYFIAEALSIFTWQIMTDVWGKIPYSEALKGNEGLVNPKYDEGKFIYEDLLKRVDALLQKDVSSAYVDPSYDFVFKGKMNHWKKFANSLKLKLMLRLSETSSYDNAKVLTFVNSGAEFLSKSAKISGDVWDDSREGKRHPMREFSTGDASTLGGNVIACMSITEFLRENRDPRLKTLFLRNGSDEIQGAFFGDFNAKNVDSDQDGVKDDKEDFSKSSFVGDVVDMDLMIMSDWEVSFYLAEVYARSGDNANAKRFYDQAVNASLKQHGLSDSYSVDSLDNTSWVDGTPEEGLKQIGMQKWVAYANYQHMEAFLERNRLKVPGLSQMIIEADRQLSYGNFPMGWLTLSVTGRTRTNGSLPSAPLYPTYVLQRNENSPVQKPDMLQNVWWNLKPENKN